MRSKSYYATVVGSSFLLLTISCMVQDAKVDEKKADEKKADTPVVERSSGGTEVDGDAGKKPDDTEGPLHAIGGTGSSIMLLPDHLPPLIGDPPDKECPTGEMEFEGGCRDKEKIDKILDKRRKKAVIKVQKAAKPHQAADAAYELIEQQIAQMDKTEDDLDEIIEQLKEEKREEEFDKKGGRP